jgi:Gram-negative bacterial TonB protein C-terminal
MRHACITFAVLLCCSSGSAQSRPASESYLHRASSIILATLGPQLQKHPERLTGMIKVALRIDQEGHIHIQKVLSTSPNRWMQDTAMRVLHSIKLPPMPKDVVAEQGHGWIDFQADWSFVPDQ